MAQQKLDRKDFQIAVKTETPKVITGASNANPIIITSVGHNLESTQKVTISDVGGNTNSNGLKTVTNSTSFTGDGSNTTFTFSDGILLTTPASYRVSIDGDNQATTTYTLDASANTITFTSAPGNGLAIVVIHLDTFYINAAGNSNYTSGGEFVTAEGVRFKKEAQKGELFYDTGENKLYIATTTAGVFVAGGPQNPDSILKSIALT